MRYRDFEYHAAEYFGLTGDEVAALVDAIEAEGGTIRGVDEDDRSFWLDVAQMDVVEELVGEYDEPEQYPLDSRFPDDDYLDAGEEWEVTAESIEGYGDET
jgi:hypothetical protein